MISFYEIFDSSILTEKYSSFQSSHVGKFSFYSHTWVDKKMVRHAMLKQFPKIVIGKIFSINVSGDSRRFKGIKGRCKNRKKFIVNVLHGSVDIGLVG